MNQHLYAALEDRLVRDAGLSGADYKVLVPLSETPGGVLRARELGTEIGWDRSRLSHHITRMEKRGLVAREECSEDGRGSMVRLSAAGPRARARAARGRAAHVYRYLRHPLSHKVVEAHTAVVARALRKVARASG